MYEPTAVPGSFPGLRAWLAAQLRQLADNLAAPTVRMLNIVSLHEPPERVSDGDIVRADGTDWDPGAGAGVYARISGAWVKL